MEVYSDNFSGVNGNPPDPATWSLDLNGGTIDIQDNALRIVAPAGVRFVTASNIGRLVGDFDVSIDFQLITYPSVDYWEIGIDVQVEGTITHYAIFRHYRTAYGSAAYHCWYYNGSYHNNGNSPTADSSGKLRITRVGNLFKCYYWQDSAWVELDTDGTVIAEGDTCIVSLTNQTTSPEVDVRFDSFKSIARIAPIGIASEEAVGVPALRLWSNVPGPLYSPNKSSFFMAGRPWYGMKMKVELGWKKGPDSFTDFVTLFLGKVTKWGPVARSVDASGVAQPTTVEVYAQDWIMECLRKRIALPLPDGTPNPLTFGEFLCTGEVISGWSPTPVVASAYFEGNNFNELTQKVEANGGVVSLIPGMNGAYAMRAATTANSGGQNAYGSVKAPEAGELFISGTMRFKTVPATIDNLNMTFLDVLAQNGNSLYKLQLHDTGNIRASRGPHNSTFNVNSYVNVPVPFALWWLPGPRNRASFWINGEEVLTHYSFYDSPDAQEIVFGVQTGAAHEAWEIDFDEIEIRTKYFYNGFQVTGGPFEDIGTVYLDKIAQPPEKDVGIRVQTVTRYPEYGIVTITSTNPEFTPSSEVVFRVIKHAGGLHALDIISALLEEAGLTEYVDVDALAAAYAACPGDIINARFEGGGDRNRLVMKDIASLGLPIADALKEITSRCLYWIFIDAGKIIIKPYTGTPPASPVVALDGSNLFEAAQTVDMENLNAFVSATYGWYDHDPTLFVVAGNQAAGGQGTGRDYTWGSPVACESKDMVTAKVGLLLKFLYAVERLEPVRMNLSGARVQLMEPVSVSDPILNDAPFTYFVTRKEISLNPGSFEVNMQLIRFLGEI